MWSYIQTLTSKIRGRYNRWMLVRHPFTSEEKDTLAWVDKLKEGMDDK